MSTESNLNEAKDTQLRADALDYHRSPVRGKIEVVAHQDFSGRYLKYLTKKFLKKQQLRDWLRVVSTSKGEYSLKFFNVVGDDNEEDED